MPTILVIDDENTILENIKFVLELQDFNVLTAPSGEEGLRIFREKYKLIDVVVTDMKMPKISGMDILREIKKTSPEISVIILTGHGDLENAIQAMKEGAFEYLKKPIDADDLTIAINNGIIKKNLILENLKMQSEIIHYNKYMQNLLDSAQKILLNLLPKKLPKIEGFSFAKTYQSSEKVGGDMYDIFDLGKYICFYVFDVSSHGILASVITVLLKSFIQNMEYNFSKNPENIDLCKSIYDLNNHLAVNTAQNTFATLFMGFLEKETKILHYISAGHIEQYIFNHNDLTPLNSTATVLGVFENVDFPCCQIQLKSGDKIILFTDGITEASYGGILFGHDRLINILREKSNSPIEEITNTIFEQVMKYSKNEINDDMTILGIEIL